MLGENRTLKGSGNDSFPRRRAVRSGATNVENRWFSKSDAGASEIAKRLPSGTRI